MLDGGPGDRLSAINKCHVASQYRGFSMFVLTNGGECLSSVEAPLIYDDNGKSSHCRDFRGGGDGENDVFSIDNRKFYPHQKQ